MRNSTAKFLTNCTVYLCQTEVWDYFLSKALFATLPQFSMSGFPFFSFHPPPQLSAQREVPVPSLAWPSSLHFQGLYSNPWPVTFSLFILSFSLPGSMPQHTLCSCSILPHADAICFLCCCLSRDNLAHCPHTVTILSLRKFSPQLDGLGWADCCKNTQTMGR